MKKRKKTAMEIAIEKAERELDRELNIQTPLIYGSAAIALRRFWGWGTKRIQKVFDQTQDIWEECSSTNAKSMIQMLDEQTGIDLRIPGSNRSWKDLAFLNADINMRLSPERWLYMRKQQIKWTNAQVRACLFLSLNRAEGFGGVRIQRLTEQMDAVQQEYSCNVPEIIKACKEITGVQLHSAMFGENRGRKNE